MSGSNSTTISTYVLYCMLLLLAAPATMRAEDEVETPTATDNAATDTDDEVVPVTQVEEPKFKALPPLAKPWVRFGKDKDMVWINGKTKQVAVDGEVSLTKGYLEMFACILGTKEHESVVALRSKAFVIHAGLLAVGAKPGAPAAWRPNYQPANGPVIAVEVEWYDEKAELKRTNAKQWVRDLKTKKAIEHDWVFGGSLCVVDPNTKKRYYRAEGGEVICVSNFPTSMMDLPIESSQANDELGFEALTENIPTRRTPVRMYLTPKVKKKDSKGELKKEKKEARVQK